MPDQKHAAVQFLNLVMQKKIQEAYDTYIAPDFIHHNQYFKGDRKSLLDAMQLAHQQNPDTTITIHQVLQEGNTVITHSHVKHSPEQPGVTVVHIFRFEGNKVVELWDVGQLIGPEQINENGLF